MGRFKVTRRPRTVYKQACHRVIVNDLGDTVKRYCLVTLEIPKGTQIRLNMKGERKCRAARAITKRIQHVFVDRDHDFDLPWKMPLNRFQEEAQDIEEAFSLYESAYTYVVGKEQIPTEPFDDTLDEDCASGIHFFQTLEEALKY